MQNSFIQKSFECDNSFDLRQSKHIKAAALVIKNEHQIRICERYCMTTKNNSNVYRAKLTEKYVFYEFICFN